MITDSGIPIANTSKNVNAAETNDDNEELSPALLVVDVAQNAVKRILNSQKNTQQNNFYPSTDYDPSVYVQVNGKPCFQINQ